MQLLRGQLARDDYLRSVQALLTMIREDERLQPVAEGINLSRLMLGTIE